jgi:8-oxo-dGTP pyrophosphatase MutT (NUDIX family)
MDDSPWTVLGSRRLIEDRWMRLRADRLRNASGVELSPWYVLDYPDWAVVVALTPDDRMVLVRQFRPGAGAAILELPGGMMEPAESDPIAAARREFAEETGYAAASFRPVSVLPNDPAHAGNRIHVVLAEGAAPAAAQRLDTGEEITVEALPVATVLAGLAAGLVGNAAHAGGILLALRLAGRIDF